MRFRSLIVAMLGSAVALGSLAAAHAQEWRGHDQQAQNWRDHDRDRADRERADRDRHDWDRHDWDRHDWDRGYAAPPVVVTPPATYGYYAPPPVVYSPGISFGITIR